MMQRQIEKNSQMHSSMENNSKGPIQMGPNGIQPLHQGKWTPEEEEYVECLIQEFKTGLLPLAEGTSLRIFLSKMLNCDPMRISKKFVGSNYNGKQLYARKPNTMANDEVIKRRTKLRELEQKFLKRVLPLNGNSGGGEDGGATESPNNHNSNSSHPSLHASGSATGSNVGRSSIPSDMGDNAFMDPSQQQLLHGDMAGADASLFANARAGLQQPRVNSRAAAAGRALLLGAGAMKASGGAGNLQTQQGLSHASSMEIMAELRRRTGGGGGGLAAGLSGGDDTANILGNTLARQASCSSLDLDAAVDQLQRGRNSSTDNLLNSFGMSRNHRAAAPPPGLSAANGFLDPALERALQSLSAARNTTNISALSLNSFSSQNDIRRSARSLSRLTGADLSGNVPDGGRNWSPSNPNNESNKSNHLSELMMQHLSKASGAGGVGVGAFGAGSSSASNLKNLFLNSLNGGDSTKDTFGFGGLDSSDKGNLSCSAAAIANAMKLSKSGGGGTSHFSSSEDYLKTLMLNVKSNADAGGSSSNMNAFDGIGSSMASSGSLSAFADLLKMKGKSKDNTNGLHPNQSFNPTSSQQQWNQQLEILLQQRSANESTTQMGDIASLLGGMSSSSQQEKSSSSNNNNNNRTRQMLMEQQMRQLMGGGNTTNNNDHQLDLPSNLSMENMAASFSAAAAAGNNSNAGLDMDHLTMDQMRRLLEGKQAGSSISNIGGLESMKRSFGFCSNTDLSSSKNNDNEDSEETRHWKKLKAVTEIVPL